RSDLFSAIKVRSRLQCFQIRVRAQPADAGIKGVIHLATNVWSRQRNNQIGGELLYGSARQDRFTAQTQIFFALRGTQGLSKARERTAHHQAENTLAMAPGKIHQDPATHRQTHKMRLIYLQLVHETDNVRTDILKSEISVIVVRITIAAHIPGHCPVAQAAKIQELVCPVIFVSTNAMQENNRLWSGTTLGIGNSWRTGYVMNHDIQRDSVSLLAKG